MTQTTHYAIDVQLPVRAKHHFEQHFSLQLELAGLLRINRDGLGENFHLHRGRSTINLCLDYVVGNFLRPESRSLHRRASISIVTLRDAVSESHTRDRSLDPFRAARAVAVAR